MLGCSETRANLKAVMDRVVEDRSPAVVWRKRGEPVVMVSVADWNLIRACLRSPFKGTGKPERLRGAPQGWWPRRITLEGRLVYRVAGKGDSQQLDVAQCRPHH